MESALKMAKHSRIANQVGANPSCIKRYMPRAEAENVPFMIPQAEMRNSSRECNIEVSGSGSA